MDIIKELNKIININIVISIIKGVNLGNISLYIRYFIFIYIKDCIILGRE